MSFGTKLPLLLAVGFVVLGSKRMNGARSCITAPALPGRCAIG